MKMSEERGLEGFFQSYLSPCLTYNGGGDAEFSERPFQSYLSPCLTEKGIGKVRIVKDFQSYLSPCLTNAWIDHAKGNITIAFNPTLVRV